MSTPKCPNHTCPLVDCQSTGKGEGVGICPISGWHFQYNEDYLDGESEMRVDKWGRKLTTYKYRQIDGGGTGG